MLSHYKSAIQCSLLVKGPTTSADEWEVWMLDIGDHPRCVWLVNKPPTVYELLLFIVLVAILLELCTLLNAATCFYHIFFIECWSSQPGFGTNANVSRIACILLSCAVRTSDFFSGSNYEHPLKVTIIKGHFNWIAVAFQHFVGLYRYTLCHCHSV